MKLYSSCKWVVLIELQLSCNELHYIYNELQVCYAIKNLNYKASCKTFFFLIMSIRVLVVQPSGDITICVDP
jgi:hypothetical protein